MPPDLPAGESACEFALDLCEAIRNGRIHHLVAHLHPNAPDDLGIDLDVEDEFATVVLRQSAARRSVCRWLSGAATVTSATERRWRAARMSLKWSSAIATRSPRGCTAAVVDEGDRVGLGPTCEQIGHEGALRVGTGIGVECAGELMVGLEESGEAEELLFDLTELADLLRAAAIAVTPATSRLVTKSCVRAQR